MHVEPGRPWEPRLLCSIQESGDNSDSVLKLGISVWISLDWKNWICWQLGMWCFLSVLIVSAGAQEQAAQKEGQEQEEEGKEE